MLLLYGSGSHKAILPLPTPRYLPDPPLTAVRSSMSDSLPFYEYERTWSVDPNLLRQRVDLQQPWSIVQAYFDTQDLGIERSMRLIPARSIAVERTKTITYNGVRLKTSNETDYLLGLKEAQTAPRVATKERHLVVDDWGRAWLVDHFQDLDIWVAETEFLNEHQMESLTHWPIWLEAEATGSPAGYTRNRAYERSPTELLRVIEYARKTGSTAVYLPGEIPDFKWAQAPGLRSK